MTTAPRPHPFEGAGAGPPGSGAAGLVLGLPVDGGVSFRRGAAEGPEGIRRFSGGIETYSPTTGRDLVDADVVDLGDATGDVGEAVSAALDEGWSGGAHPVLALLGGDHSVTPRAVAAVAERADRLAVVGFDAHLDLREDYPGDHACTYRRIAERGIPCVVLGPRSGARSEWEDAPVVLEHCSRELVIPDEVRGALSGRDVYVTVDIDVLDPSAAPGTGNPEPGGPGFEALLGAIDALRGLRVVAVDVVEVSPPFDPSGVTQATGAVLVRELLTRFAPVG